MTNLMKIISVAACTVGIHGTALAEAFFFSKVTDAGKVLAQFAVYLGAEGDEVASYSDMQKTHLRSCMPSTRKSGSTIGDDGETMPVRMPIVSLGTLVSVRRSDDPNAFITGIFESTATPAGCIPSVSGSRFIAEVKLAKGARTKVAAQLEPDGTRATWWLEREQAPEGGGGGSAQ